MQRRAAAIRAFRWLILAACLILAFGIARLFWMDASDGRMERETERLGDAQEQVQEAAPATQVPAAPAQE